MKASTGQPPIRESEFYCSAEWHMVQMKSPRAAPIYTWARKVSSGSGSFHASAQNMAAYFRVDRKVILRALKELAAYGFLVLDRAERGKPNKYKVIDHKEWAATHQGLCVQEIAFPWKGEGDPLGRQLYATSGGRTKFWPNQMTGLRNLGFGDEEIAELFRRFLAKWDYIGSAWDHVYYDFRKELKTLATRSDASHRGDTLGRKGVPPKGQAGVPPKGHYSTKYSSNVGKGDSTIPAGAALLCHLIPNSKAKPSQEERTATPAPIAKRESIRKGMTQDELDERRRFLLKQREEILAKYPQASIRSGQAH
jgi:hypothetical protein